MRLAAVAFYAGTLTVTGAVIRLIWIYATTGRRLISPSVIPQLVRRNLWRAASVPSVFGISIAIALVYNPTVAEYSWLTIAVLLFVLRWIYRDSR